MINHSNCEHEATSAARAKCRRAIAGGTKSRPATSTDVDFRGSGAKKAQTPRDRDKQCMNCGVERIVMRGTDPITGILYYVGERCEYIVRHAPDITPIDD